MFQWPPNFKKKIIELAKTENRSPKRHLFDLFINTEITEREPVSIPFLLSFAAKLSFSLFLSSLFRLYHHTVHPFSSSPSTLLQRSRGFDAAIGLAT